ncbi:MULTISPECIES: hypothetical protein [unclassified Pedobacter]|uniref:hypothetical protein n=1 Tax=unclassified Pedobacter TaxID=2628915 RepID=UPI00142153A6|nr:MULTISPECIES: hypothetical protein [unclassified Pedobacter]NII81745.1 hypothetical protein [Pedobacter sp. SG908]NMN35748.1 hypothetical protein [Pedobacter sp. SG918]
MTKPALDVQYTTAQLNGSTDITDPTTVLAIAFLLSKTDDFTTTTRINIPFDYGNVSKLVLGLEDNQVYFFELQVIYIGGEVEKGGVLSFQTLVISTGGLETRPHVMTFVIPGAPGGQDPDTGYPLPDDPGQSIEVPCRFHLASNGAMKTFKNEDSTIINQVGTIRVDAGQTIPEVNMIVNVEGHFKGPVRAIYRGQLSHRIEV